MGEPQMNTEIKSINPAYKEALAELKTSIKASASETKGLRHAGRVALMEARRIEANNLATNSFDKSWNGLRAKYHANRDEANGNRYSQRCHLLAYGFLRGKIYLQIEAKCGYKILPEYVANLIPDIGDGVSKDAMITHVKLWMEIGTVTRDQIINDVAGIVARRDAMVKVRVAKENLADWDKKTARIEQDMKYYRNQGFTAAANRYQADLNYAMSKRDKAITTLSLAESALDVTFTNQVAA